MEVVPDVPLGDLVDEITVGWVGPMANEYVQTGVPFLRTLNVRPHSISTTELKYITPEFHEKIKKSRLRPGDVVIARTGRPGTAAVVPDWLGDANCSDLVVIRPGSRVDSRFLSYYLNSQVGQHLIRARNVGSVQSHFNIGSAKRLPFPQRPIEEQRRIAAVLGALDDKIELNRKMNRTLEQIAQGIFKSWFIDFDSEEYRICVQDLIDVGTLDVGDGYRAKRVELDDEGIPFARAGNINSGFRFQSAELLGFRGVEKAKHKVSRPGDIVFTSKGTVGRFAFVQPTTPRFAYSPQLCFWRSLDQERLSPYFLFEWMKSPSFLAQVAAVKGQTDMAEYVSLRDQRRMKISVPPPDDQQQLAQILKPLSLRRSLLVDESQTLSDLRDVLLPSLVSGEIKVPDLGDDQLGVVA